jgi:hypothetical protein
VKSDPRLENPGNIALADIQPMPRAFAFAKNPQQILVACASVA